MEHATLDLRVVSLSPTLGVEITKKKKIFVLNVHLFTFEREREHEWERGRQRGRQRIPSRPHAASIDPDTGLEPTTYEIVT